MTTQTTQSNPIIDTAAVLLPKYPAVWSNGYIDLDELPAYPSSGEVAIAVALHELWAQRGTLGQLHRLDPDKRGILLDLIDTVYR